jgi:hypothetical protein
MEARDGQNEHRTPMHRGRLPTFCGTPITVMSPTPESQPRAADRDKHGHPRATQSPGGDQRFREIEAPIRSGRLLKDTDRGRHFAARAPTGPRDFWGQTPVRSSTLRPPSAAVRMLDARVLGRTGRENQVKLQFRRRVPPGRRNGQELL